MLARGPLRHPNELEVKVLARCPARQRLVLFQPTYPHLTGKGAPLPLPTYLRNRPQRAGVMDLPTYPPLPAVFVDNLVRTCRQMVDKKVAHDIDDGSCRHVGRGDDHLPQGDRRSASIAPARVWDFLRTTLASGVANLPTYPPCRPDGRGRTYLPTPRAYLSGGPTHYEKT